MSDLKLQATGSLLAICNIAALDAETLRLSYLAREILLRKRVVHGRGWLFFLVGSVDRPIARRLVTLLVVQVVVGVAAASVRPFTPVAFCTLAPVFGLGVLALCGADRKSTRLNSSHIPLSRMPSSA